MTLSLAHLLPLVLQAVRSPREAAHTLLSLGIPLAALPIALALVVVLSVLMAALGAMVEPGTTELPPTLPLVGSAALIGGFLVAYIWGIQRGGRALGGTGTLPEAALLVIFLQFVLLVAQVVQILLWLVAPPLAGVFVIGASILALWININFIDVLHDYGSLPKSFLVWLLVTLGIALVVLFLMTLAGVSVQG